MAEDVFPRLIVPELYSGPGGLAAFRAMTLTLTQGSALTRLGPLSVCQGWQLRQSPKNFSSPFHCTANPQLLVVLSGKMQIRLRRGQSRVFGPGQFFYSNDTLAAGELFDPTLHGHSSQSVGNEPLVTLFVRTPVCHEP